MTDHSDERALVERAIAGDAGAFGSLYQRHVDRVYSYIRMRVRDVALAEDLTQEVFIQAMRSLERFQWQGSLAPWLMRIARNIVIDHWRRASRRMDRTQSAVEAAVDEDGESSRLERVEDESWQAALAAAEARMDHGRIRTAMTQLTELQSQVLALRFAAGLSIRETAVAMGRSDGAIKNLQHHALRALRRLLELDDSGSGEDVP